MPLLEDSTRYTPPSSINRIDTLRIMAPVAIETADEFPYYLSLALAYETDGEHDAKDYNLSPYSWFLQYSIAFATDIGYIYGMTW